MSRRLDALRILVADDYELMRQGKPGLSSISKRVGSRRQCVELTQGVPLVIPMRRHFTRAASVDAAFFSRWRRGRRAVAGVPCAGCGRYLLAVPISVAAGHRGDLRHKKRSQCRRSGSSWFVTSTVSHVQIAPLCFRNIAVCGKQAPYVRCGKYLKWGWNLKLALGEVQLPNAAKIRLRSALSPDRCGQDGQQRGRKRKSACVSVSCEPSMAMKVPHGKR